MNNEKWILAGVAALVLFQVLSFFNLGSALGVGTPYIEDYDPFVKTYGINTTKDITTTGTVTGAASAFSGLMALTGTFKLGSSGTAQTNEVVTTCSMVANNSIAATSTGYAYCTGVTGVTSSDKVLANFATSTLGFPGVGQSWVIISSFASSTAGAIDFLLLNLTGGAAAPSAGGRIGSTTVIRAGY